MMFMRHRIAEGDGHKINDGHMSICFDFPNYDEDPEGKAAPRLNIHMDCFMIGPSRHYDWSGETIEEVLQKTEKDVYQWMEEECDS